MWSSLSEVLWVYGVAIQLYFYYSSTTGIAYGPITFWVLNTNMEGFVIKILITGRVNCLTVGSKQQHKLWLAVFYQSVAVGLINMITVDSLYCGYCHTSDYLPYCKYRLCFVLWLLYTIHLKYFIMLYYTWYYWLGTLFYTDWDRKKTYYLLLCMTIDA